MKDISEAMVAGHSTRDLEMAAVPMATMQERGRMNAAHRGYQIMQKAVEEVIAEQNKAKQKEILLDLHDDVEQLAHSWLKFEPEMTKDFFRIQNVNGLGTSARSLLRLVKATARNHKKDIREEKSAAPAKVPSGPRHMPEEHILQMLTYRPSGKPEPTKLNVETILRNDSRLRGRIRFCEFDGKAHVNGKPVDDLLIAKTDSWISKTYGIETAHKTLGMLLFLVASDEKYHPVREWLDSLEWDGKHRLKDMAVDVYRSPDCTDNNRIDKPAEAKTHDLAEYNEDLKIFGFNYDDTPYVVQIYIIRMLVGAVARAYKMGEKLDTVAVMIGEQGISKSEGIAALCPELSWFSDSKLDIRNKDVYQCIQGKWIVELPECSALHESGYNSAKSFLSSRSDRYRMAYGAHAVDQKRSCIFIGTTNETSLGFLNDPSGTRRYWVFQVGQIGFHQLVQKDYVEMIWAEAVHFHQKGRQHWLREWEEPARHRLNEQFRQVDTWEDAIHAWISEKVLSLLYQYEQWEHEDRNAKNFEQNCEFTTAEILSEALRVPSQYQKRTDITRASRIISKAGCTQGRQRRFGGTRTRVWAVPTVTIARFVSDGIACNEKLKAFHKIIEDWE